jgi:hypothetical protein
LDARGEQGHAVFGAPDDVVVEFPVDVAGHGGSLSVLGLGGFGLWVSVGCRLWCLKAAFG